MEEPLSEEEVQSGFFGKLPSTGDFVHRGLPERFRRSWDKWLTRHVAPHQKLDDAWPDGGLRFRLVSGGRVAAGVILPSSDSVGRRFPLSLMLVATKLPAPEELDTWCDAAFLLDRSHAPDVLWADLDSLSVPVGEGADIPLQLWVKGRAVQSVDPLTPDAGLDAIWSSGQPAS